jgi:hypothetical protein
MDKRKIRVRYIYGEYYSNAERGLSAEDFRVMALAKLKLQLLVQMATQGVRIDYSMIYDLPPWMKRFEEGSQTWLPSSGAVKCVITGPHEHRELRRALHGQEELTVVYKLITIAGGDRYVTATIYTAPEVKLDRFVITFEVNTRTGGPSFRTS